MGGKWKDRRDEQKKKEEIEGGGGGKRKEDLGTESVRAELGQDLMLGAVSLPTTESLTSFLILMTMAECGDGEEGEAVDEVG